ncbi:MAG TPA: protein kinase [Polyangia bacterium]
MPQYLQERNSDWPRTLHGFGRQDESPQADGSWESRFVPIGARVGRSGQVFETEGAAGAGPLVVKLFTWGAGLPEAVVQDFTREAMTVANLRHPHVARVVDAGTLGDGTPFVVMERLAGMTLDEMAAGAALSIGEVVAIVRGVGSALFAAHEAGVAHGAVRADNVFVAEPAGCGLACPKLLDFGVAKLAAAARALGRFVDEPWAPAPAHVELGRRAGERADQLALATLAWRLLGGASSPAVERALFRAMSPDPSLRFGAVTAFVAALEEASVSAPVVVNAPVAAVAAVRPRAAAPVAAPPQPASPPSSLTQQFFAEGEQLEVAHAAGRAAAAAAVGAGDHEEEEDDLEIAAPARVPRSRAQMAVAALLALTSVAIIAGTVASLADKPVSGPVAAETARPTGEPSLSPPASRWPAVPAAPAAASHARKKLASARELPAAPAPARVEAPRAASPPAADFPGPPDRPAPVAAAAPAAVPVAAPAAVPVAAPAAAPPSPAAPPAEAATPREAAPPAGDNAAPASGAAPAAASDDGETQPGEQAADAPPAGAPAPSAPPEAAPPPPAAP